MLQTILEQCPVTKSEQRWYPRTVDMSSICELFTTKTWPSNSTAFANEDLSNVRGLSAYVLGIGASTVFSFRERNNV